MNTVLNNKYDFALRAVLMEEEEIRAQNMRIISRESIYSSPFPRPNRPTFRRRKPVSFELSSPLITLRFAGRSV